MVKICDLGTAIDREDAATAHAQVTPYLISRFYRAPEVILGMDYDYAIDVWSIGCTLFELFTGKILFPGSSNNQMLKAMMEVRGRMNHKYYKRGQLWRCHFDDKNNFLSKEHDHATHRVRRPSSTVFSFCLLFFFLFFWFAMPVASSTPAPWQSTPPRGRSRAKA